MTPQPAVVSAGYGDVGQVARKRRRYVVVLRMAVVCGALLFSAAARANDFAILYHERLVEWRLAARDDAKPEAVRSRNGADGPLLSFVAFGREFHARLEPNERLLRGLLRAGRPSLPGVELWRGELVDVPGSWVRVMRAGRELSGVVFDGADLFAIDSPVRLRSRLRSPESPVYTGPIIYRWRDTAGTLTDDFEAGMNRAGETAAGLAPMSAAVALDPPRQLDLGLVADAQLSARDGPNTEALLLSRANVVDGIFMYQLGLHVNVAEITVFTEETDPFSAVAPAQLLAELEEHRATTPAQSAQDLTHLLTGRDLADSGTGQTVGFAHFATVCDARLGVALTQATAGIATDALIMAHEIAHNFGAPHDGAPGPCSSTPSTYIMAPSVNGSSDFSECSIQQMLPELGSACLGPLTPGDVELYVTGAPGDAIAGHPFTVTAVIDNPSAQDAHGLELTASGANLEVVSLRALSPGVECVNGPVPRCRKTRLAGGQVAEIELVVQTISAAPATLDVSAVAANDTNHANNAVSLEFGVRPTIELVVEFRAAPSIVQPGELLQHSIVVRNVGAVTATNALARLQIAHTLTVMTLLSDAGSCAPDLLPWYSCSMGDLPPGAARTLQLTVRAQDDIAPNRFTDGTVQVELQADQPAADVSGMFAISSVIIADSVADLRTTVSTALQFRLNDPAELVVTIANLGPDSAADVVLEQRGGAVANDQGLAGIVVATNVGECTIGPFAMNFSCAVSELRSGESLVVSIRGTAATIGQFGMSSTARLGSWDPDLDNNVADAVYGVTGTTMQPPPGTASGGGSGGGAQSGSGGGGGGGAVGALYVALLGLALTGRLIELRRHTRSSRVVRESASKSKTKA